jgi:hypothetical protein
MKLTKFGEFAVKYTVSTAPKWWKDLLNEANKIAEEDGDLDVFFDEKIFGLMEMKHNLHTLSAPAQPKGD